MSDEELLIMYSKYKKKRLIVIISILFIIIFVILGSYMFFHFNNDSSKVENDNTPDPVIIKDEVAPIIKLKVDTLEILKGDDINYIDYIDSVIDDVDGNLIDKVEYKEIDTNLLENQTIIYTISDNSGNTSQATIQVTIKETPTEEQHQEDTTSNDTKPIIQDEQSTQSKQDNTSPSSSEDNTSTIENPSSQKVIKYFLFSDGYTMKNVAEVCAAELKKTNKTGMCSPIQDENGIYLGMKLETN